jgi:hypothetical protein
MRKIYNIKIEIISFTIYFNSDVTIFYGKIYIKCACLSEVFALSSWSLIGYILLTRDEKMFITYIKQVITVSRGVFKGCKPILFRIFFARRVLFLNY